MALPIRYGDVGKTLFIRLLTQMPLQQVEEALQTRQRCSEFVARHPNKLVFALLKLFELGDIVQDAHDCPGPAIPIHHRGRGNHEPADFLALLLVSAYRHGCLALSCKDSPAWKACYGKRLSVFIGHFKLLLVCKSRSLEQFIYRRIATQGGHSLVGIEDLAGGIL